MSNDRLTGDIQPQPGLMDAMRREGYTYTRLADAVGVTRPAVSKWARGLRRPALKQAVRTVEVLNSRFEHVWTYRSDETTEGRLP